MEQLLDGREILQINEIQTKHREEHIIFNGDIIVPLQTLRKDTLKNVYDDVHCSVMSTQRKFKLHFW